MKEIRLTNKESQTITLSTKTVKPVEMITEKSTNEVKLEDSVSSLSTDLSNKKSCEQSNITPPTTVLNKKIDAEINRATEAEKDLQNQIKEIGQADVKDVQVDGVSVVKNRTANIELSKKIIPIRDSVIEETKRATKAEEENNQKVLVLGQKVDNQVLILGEKIDKVNKEALMKDNKVGTDLNDIEDLRTTGSYIYIY